MEFTTDQLTAIEELSALDYTVEQIEIYLNLPKNSLQEEYNDKDSVFRTHFERGILISKMDIERKLLSLAKEGNIAAIQELEKSKISRRVDEIKKEIKDEN